MANAINRGWKLTKSSWQVVRLDKELAVLPVLSILVSLVVTLGLFAAGFALLASSSYLNITTGNTGVAGGSYTAPAWLNLTALFVIYFIFTFISNFFGGALICGATERFKGGNPTVKSSLAGARRRIYPLAGFSLLMTTVGVLLQLIEERVPFAGKIAVWLLGAAWSIANVFALPIIVLSDHAVKPLEATKLSVTTIKKIWGESLVVNTGIAIIGLLGTIIYALVMGLVLGLLIAVHVPTSLAIASIALSFAGLIALLILFSTFSAVAKAALYHYAVTGSAPDNFNTELLHSTINLKKARKIFG